MKLWAVCMLTLGGLVLGLGSNHAGDKKITIKEVMKEAHQGKLMAKVADGSANEEQKKRLVELYEALAKNDPPKGEGDNWKKVTSNLVKAAKAAATGDDKAAKSLPKLANCKGCHSVHK